MNEDKDCERCVHESKSPMAEPCRNCGIAMMNFEPKKRMKNADRIRAMTDAELAEWFANKDTCPPGACTHMYDGVDCDKCWLDWLRQEASEDAD